MPGMPEPANLARRAPPALDPPARFPSGFLDHIRRCNNHDMGRFCRFYAADTQVGWIREDFLALLADFADVFDVSSDSISLSDRLATAEERTSAMRRVVRRLIDDGVLAKFRGEDYAIVPQWGRPALFNLDRSAIPLFGCKAFGIHVNGYRRHQGRIQLWIGRRAPDKAVEPDKLDNMVAGGQPAGLTLEENLVKEGGEEAGLSPALARQAKPVSAITYCMENERGLKPDTLFVYDLELPPDFAPVNTDGEIASFSLMELDEVAERVRTTGDFKFNVALVIIDFLIRHGYLSPDREPDYLALATGLHAPL